MEKEGLIEKYIQNRLNSEERKKFDALYKNDANFRKEILFQKDLKKVASLNDKMDDSEFRGFINDLEHKAKNRRPYFFSGKWLAAASILLLLGITYFITIYNSASDDIFTDYFEPYRNVIQPIERGNALDNDKSKAFKFYENGEYKKAILLFTTLYQKTNESYYLFYKANALMKTNRVNEAIPLLDAYLSKKEMFTDKAQWYLSLAYLELKDTAKAKTYLNHVVSNKSYKLKEAKEILKKLD